MQDLFCTCKVEIFFFPLRIYYFGQNLYELFY